MPTAPFDTEHDALRDTVRRLVEGPLAAAATGAESGATPHLDAARRCAEIGLFELGDPLAEVAAAEELGRLRSGGLTAYLLDAMLASALLPQAPPGTVAIAVDDTVEAKDGRATGELPFVTGGAVATTCIVLDSGVAIDLAEGCTVTPAADAYALRGGAVATIAALRAPAETLDIPPAALGTAALLQAAAAVAGSWLVWADAKEYAQQRTAFGRPIGRFQVNRHAIAELATKLTAAEALVHDIAWRRAKGEDAATAAVRLYAGRVAEEVADRALQLHGGYGYTTAFDVARSWRDAAALRLGDERRRRRIEQGAPS